MQLLLNTKPLALDLSVQNEGGGSHRRERIAQFVGDCRGELSELGHPARFHHLLLGVLQFLNVVRKLRVKPRDLVIHRLEIVDFRNVNKGDHHGAAGNAGILPPTGRNNHGARDDLATGQEIGLKTRGSTDHFRDTVGRATGKHVLRIGRRKLRFRHAKKIE